MNLPTLSSSTSNEPNLPNSNARESGKFISLLKEAWKSTRQVYGCFLSGLVFAALLNEVIKTLVAEPRPHFLDTCKPKNLNCTKPGE